MRKRFGILVAATLAVGAMIGLSGCVSEADTVSKNLSTDADNFRVERMIVFYNGITDKYIAEVTGRCSVTEQESLNNTLAVTCKIGDNRFIKNFLGKSDNVTWFMLQEKPVKEDVYHYKMIFKPEVVIPNLGVNTSQGSAGASSDTDH